MAVEFTLGAWDFIVISVVMVISVSIGVFFRFTGSRQKTADEFLMAGRHMTRFPVIFSLVATKLSGILLIGEPADTFLFGTQRCIALSFVFIGCLVAAYVFLPVFYAVKAPTIYVYLEHRFGERTRRVISVLCFFQMLFHLSVALYAPALALAATTELDLNTCFIVMGVVSTLFSALGGMKAVMWADVFQLLCMFACLTTVLAFGVWEVGGLGNAYARAHESGRMDLFNFSFDPTLRYTFWSSLAFGIQFGISSICVNQSEMQRAFTINKLENAQSAFLWSSIPSFLISVLTNTIGLVMFAIFRNCNPLSESSGVGLGKADQILPYYIVSRMTSYPGVAGLCVSGIFCGSISSMSSAVNSMSTIIIDDFIKPNISAKALSKINFNILAKILVVLNGAVITSLPFLIAFIRGIYEITVTVNAVIQMPVFSVFLLGMLTTTANQEGTFVGMACGVAMATWISVGSKLMGTPDKPTSLTTDGCTNASFTSLNTTTSHFLQNYTLPDISNIETHKILPRTTFPLYTLSYLWIGFIGFLTTFIMGYIASLIINCFRKPSTVEPFLLSPVRSFWMKSQHKIKEVPMESKDPKVQRDIKESTAL